MQTCPQGTKNNIAVSADPGATPGDDLLNGPESAAYLKQSLCQNVDDPPRAERGAEAADESRRAQHSTILLFGLAAGGMHPAFAAARLLDAPADE